MKTYVLRHSETEIDWTTHSDWYIGMNDVLFTAVVLTEKCSHPTIVPLFIFRVNRMHFEQFSAVGNLQT